MESQELKRLVSKIFSDEETKQEFLKNVVPVWDQKAKQREDSWKIIIAN